MTITLDLEASTSNASTRRALADISLSVAKCKKIVVVTGAGISCSSGIPDFRSSDGLYALVKQQYPDVVLKGRDLFDASLFRDSTSVSVFYTFISQLKRSIDSASPGPTHDFIKTLDAKQKLLRSYTQNIDGFEERVGLRGSSSQEAKTTGKGKSKLKVKEVRNVQLHGDIHRVRCTFCSAEFPCVEAYLEIFNKGVAPDCPECSARSSARVARSARPLKIGTLRPAIVLYDEPHPLGDDIATIQTADISRKPDMLIIMGTSLKVHGLKKLVKDFAKIVHTAPLSRSDKPKSANTWAGKVVFVNKTPPGSEWSNIIDYHVAGGTDNWVEKVLEDWKKMRPSDWEVQRTLTADSDVGGLRVAKDINSTATKSKDKGSGKHRGDLENRPANDVLSNHACSYPKTPASAPSSPSKRRQSASHYSDIESSPSKKRDVTDVSVQPKMAAEERGLLFSDATNTLPKATLPNLDEVEFPEVKPRRVRAQTVSGKTAGVAARSKSKNKQVLDHVHI